jgi:DNA-binding NarL/FixJ family response regulator
MTPTPMTEKYVIRVVLIEDDATIRDGYGYLINSNPSYRVVNGYDSAEEAFRSIKEDSPDVILLDIGLPGMTGIEALPRLKTLVPGAYIIILTVYDSEAVILDALTRGASGYLTKNTPSDKVIQSIYDVMEGGGPMSANIARLVIRSFQKNQDTPLTKRETQILEMISNGVSRTRIGKELFIDLETVKTHIKNIYFKLNVHSRADAISEAKKNKFI